MTFCESLQAQITNLVAQNTIIAGRIPADNAAIATAQAGVTVAQTALNTATNNLQNDTMQLMANTDMIRNLQQQMLTSGC